MNRTIDAESRGGSRCIADIRRTVTIFIVVINTTPLGFMILTILGYETGVSALGIQLNSFQPNELRKKVTIHTFLPFPEYVILSSCQSLKDYLCPLKHQLAMVCQVPAHPR